MYKFHKEIMEPWPFRIPSIVCGIGLALLLQELLPQVCCSVHCGPVLVAPNGGPGAFVGLE